MVEEASLEVKSRRSKFSKLIAEDGVETIESRAYQKAAVEKAKCIERTGYQKADFQKVMLSEEPVISRSVVSKEVILSKKRVL